MQVTVACTQMRCSWDTEKNIERAVGLVRKAAADDAQIILLQELFETPYFPIDEQARHLDLARSVDDHPTIRRMQDLARELGVVLPVSFFERAGPAHYNAVVVIDADGEIVNHYRKSHIPDFPGYAEKFYFCPGDTGFSAFDTRFGRIGVGICWDQWFPEAARCMALMGAEILLYPTAIGDEPGDPSVDSMPHWQNVMCGHAAANIMPLVASNRIGTERGTTSDIEMTFYGSSFIADHLGNKVEVADRETQSVLMHAFDLSAIRTYRETWGVYRDRRPEQYRALATFDGRVD